MAAKNKFIIFSLVLLVLDQSIKYFFYTRPERVGMVGYYLNQNFSWSLPVGNITVIVLTVLLLSGLIYWRSRLFGPVLAWHLIGIGAASNLIDRFVRGGVVDYIYLPYGGIINLADILILAGVIWILCSRK
jgi:signal peptidase II